MARMTYEPITEVTDELLAMRWRTDSSARMWFSRRGVAPGRLGLSIVPDGEEFRVEPKGHVRKVKPAVAPVDYESWAIEVDGLLVDANEPAEEEEVLEALFNEGMTAANAAQRIINRRARELEDASEPSPKSTPSAKSEQPAPPVVADTLADKAAAPHADSKPTLPAPSPAVVELRLFADRESAPIIARRLCDITGALIEYPGADQKTVRVQPRDSDEGSRR